MLKKAFIIASTVMACLLFLPDIDYDSAFRLHTAVDFQFTLFYIHGQEFLPIYQYIAAAFASLLFLRIVSFLCVLASGFVFNRIMRKLSRKTLADSTTILFLLNPLILLYGSLAMYESLATLLMLLMLYFYMDENFTRSSLALSIGVLTSYFLWIFAPYFAATIKKKQLLWYILPIIGIASWLRINFSLQNNPFHFLVVSKMIYNGVASKTEQLNATGNVLLYTFLFPAMFSLNSPVFALLKADRNKLSGLLKYFVATYTAALTAGLLLKIFFGFGWERFYILLIPAYLILTGPQILKSKHAKAWIIVYFAVSITSTVWQADLTWAFQKSML